MNEKRDKLNMTKTIITGAAVMMLALMGSSRTAWAQGAGCDGANFVAAAGSPVGTGDQPRSVAVGDFNTDGKPDMATANAFSDNVTILLGNGIGGFTQPASSPVGTGDSPFSVAAGDFNLDGKLDLATANAGSNNVTILLGNGTGGFTQPAGTPVAVGDQPESVAVGDFNLDGKPDLAIANAGSNNVTILLGNATGGFTQPAGSPVGAGSFSESVAVGDFNTDGKPDLATANSSSDNVTILLGNGTGGFTQPAGSPVGVGNAPQSVAVGDFNADGKADLVSADTLSDSVTILLGNGTGGFTQPAGSPVSTADGPVTVAVGDFNLDGDADLVTANFNAGNVTILLGNGTGGFTQPAGSPVGAGDARLSVAVGDFNLDGKPDLATANNLSDNLSVFLNTCDAFPCRSANFAAAAGSPVGAGAAPISVAAGDFNLDGKPDLASANADSDNVTILLGSGSGGFTQPAGSPVGVGDFPVSVAVGDFNRDGKPDLATANYVSDNVTILLGNGMGGFTQPAGSPVGVGDFPNSVAVGDFNLDGKPDLATANVEFSNVTILLGNGLGGFTQPAGSPVGVGNFPVSVAVGDFNADGKPDLGVANARSDNVTILLGNGLGGFTQPAGSPVGVGDGPVSVAVGDFNLDGKTDLATANTSSNNVTILLGNGLGGFAQPAGSPVGEGNAPRSVAVGDFDADGKPDLATANTGSDNVTVLLGDGLGGFTQPSGSPFGAGDGVAAVAVGDFNLDGKPDLATGNINSNNVSVLLNTCTADATPPVITPTVTGLLGMNGWYRSNVQVSWSVVDDESTVSSQSGCTTQSVTTDTDGVTFTCSATSGGGTASQSVTVKRDATAPTIAFASQTTPNAAGWNNTNVAVQWNCSDAMSGAITPTTTNLVDAQGANISTTGRCEDNAGNTSTNRRDGIKIDKTAPAIAFVSRTPAPNAAGWNNTNVTVNWSCTDALSGPVNAAVSQIVTTEGSNVSSTGTCQDVADNSSSNTQSGIKIDKTAPTITFASRTPAPNAAGWNNTNVTVNWNCGDVLSGPSSPTTSQFVSAEGANLSSIGTCTDVAGNSASNTQSGIKIDKTAPTITFASRTAPNAAGWNNTNVTVNWNCADALSGATSATTSQLLTIEGANLSSTGTCSDVAGNSASNTQSGIKIDKTAPTLAPTVTPNPVILNASATAAANAADALSGIASQSCAAVITSTVGFKIVACTTTDVAGNSAGANANYQVIYNFSGFSGRFSSPPVENFAFAGNALSTNFNLSGNQGLNIFAAGSPSSQQINCSTNAPIGASSPANLPTGLSFSNGTYSFIWQTDAAWAGTCRQLTVAMIDGTVKTVKITFYN